MRHGRGVADTLTAVVKVWPTPQARDSKGQGHVNHGRPLTDWDLGSSAILWPTPASRDWRAPNSQDSQDRRNADSERGQQLPNFVEHCLSPPLAPAIPAGQTSSTSTRRLNPRFVEWLMGWPIGWTDCDSPVTGFSPWLRRSRTELSAMLSRGRETGPQLSLL